MAYSAFDPVMTGFEQPSTMTPSGQLAAFSAQVGGYEPPVGAGTMAGVGVVGPVSSASGGVPQVAEGVIGGLSALGIAIPEPITTALGIAGLGYLGLQALGLGEGGGIGGNNLLGGDVSTIPGTDIKLGGPGLAEPGPGTGWALLKEWHVNYSWGRLQYYLIQKIGSKGKNTNRYIALYNTRTREWKAWRFKPPQLAVIGKNMPRHQMLTRLRRNLSRHKADARTVLKFADPVGYAKQLGYRNYKRRR